MGKGEKALLKKHGAIETGKGKGAVKRRTLAEEERAIKKTKQAFNVGQVEVEKNLTEYLAQKDPLLWDGKAIALIRRPSMKELKEIIPPDMREYIDDPDSLPKEKEVEYEQFFYQKMSEFIVVPKYTPEQWEEKSNPWFIRKFWTHFAEIAKLMEGQIEGF